MANIELFKAFSKLRTSPPAYEDFVRFLNKIPTDKDGEYTKVLTETMINLGDKTISECLDKYKINFNHVNEFMNKGQKTPQAVLDVIDKVKVGLENKDKEN